MQGRRPDGDEPRIIVLGRLAVQSGSTVAPLEVLTNAGLTLSTLIARANERVPVDDLAAVIWPIDRPSTFRKGIQVSVLRLRDLLDPDRRERSAGASPIVGHADAYELRWPLEQIDAGRFEALVRAGQRALAEGRPADASRVLRAALELWAEPFGGADVVSLREYIERLRFTHRSALTAVIEADVQLGREDLGELEQAVAEDPYDERRWGQLMIALFRRGRQVDALQTFQRARKLLADEMGLEPGPYLRKIEAQILLQEGTALSVAASGATAAGVAERLAVSWPAPPRPPDRLLHRDDDRRTIDSQLQQWRVVTIVGPPGVGKTTLAAAVAATRTEHAVAWVSLGPVGPGEAAVIDVAHLAGVRSEVGSDPAEYTDLLAARIGDHPVLLVLDNAEHLVEPLGRLVEHLVRSCPNLVVLLTSRRPLESRSERVHRLAPFATASGSSPAAVGHELSAAVEYLVRRAELGVVDRPTAQALERIASHVGGLALGLEQAAARLRTLTPQELADRLELVDEPDAADGLGRAIDWSLSLLGAEELLLFTGLAAFEGPWGLARAEAVGWVLGLAPRTVARAVHALTAHSLITVSETDPSQRRIIEPVRQHLRQRSAADGSEVRCAHAAATVVHQEVAAAARRLEGLDQRAGIQQLSVLMPDIQRTVAWAVPRRDAALLAGVLSELRSWWSASGRYADGQTLHALADPVIEAWEPTDATGSSRRLVALAAGVGTRPGFAGPALRADDLRALLDAAQAAGVPGGDHAWMAQMLSAGLTFTNQENEAAATLAREAIEEARAARDEWSAAWGLYALGIATGRTDPVEGLALLEQAVAAFDAVGDRLNAARVLMFIGHGIRIFGDPRSAEDAFARAEEWCRDLGAAPVTQLDCELGRAQSADTAGAEEEAAALYRSLVPRLWDLGDYRCAAVAQRNLGAILHRQGDLDGAAALATRSLQVFRGLDGEEAEMAAVQLLRGEIALARSQPDFAARLYGRARHLAAGGGVPMELRDHQRLEALADRLRSLLGADRFETLAAGAGHDELV